MMGLLVRVTLSIRSSNFVGYQQFHPKTVEPIVLFSIRKSGKRKALILRFSANSYKTIAKKRRSNFLK